MKKKFYRNIIFSKTPLKTHFRFEDQFQIFPCDLTNAPKSKDSQDFPLIIEFWVDEDQNPDVDEDYQGIKDFISPITNQVNRLNRITRLLSAITNHRIFPYTEMDRKWGLIIPGNITPENKEEINNQVSQVFVPLYYYPTIGQDLVISDFSDQRHPNSEYTSHYHYYYHDPIDSEKKGISLPLGIYKILAKYFLLDLKSRKVIDSVVHLICNGIDLRQKMKSFSFLSFVSAIETLVNYEYKGKKDGVVLECPDCQNVKTSPIKCTNCGRPIWGVKAKFKRFLNTYVSHNEESLKKYNRIYNLRSEIVHSGLLLLGEEQINWVSSDKGTNQWMTHIETMQLARLGLVNWLIYGPDKKPVD